MVDGKKKQRRDPDWYFKTDHLMPAMRLRAIRGSALFMGSRVVNAVLQVAQITVLARLLTPDDYGLIAMVAAFTGFVSMFKDLGLSLAVIQRPQITHEQVSTLFWINMAVCVSLMLMVAVGSPLIAIFYNKPVLTLIGLALAVEFLIGGLSVQHTALLRRQMKFVQLVSLDVAALAISLAASIFAALHGWAYWSLVLMRLTDTLVRTVAAWILCGWRPGPPVRGCDAWSLIGFGMNITAFSLVGYFANVLDRILLGRVTGAHVLGIYDRATKLSSKPMLLLNMPLREVIVPVLSRLIDEPERYRRAYLRFLGNILLISLPGIAFMVGAADWLVNTLLGDQYTEAIPIFILLGIAGWINPVPNSTGWLFVTQDRTKEMLEWGIIDAVIKVISIVIGIFWGVIGISTAVAVRALLEYPLLSWYVGRKGPVRHADFYTVLAMPAFASGVIIIALMAYRRISSIDNNLINLSIALVISCIATIIAYLIFPSGREIFAELFKAFKELVKGKSYGGGRKSGD